jgi:hypothetical protein
MKRLLGALFFLSTLAATSRAQFLGYTSPQTVQQTLATNTACTGTAQTFVFPNLGQTQHAIIMQVTVPPMVTSKVFIEGTTNGIAFTRISDELDNINLSTLTASGYYPSVRANVTCSTGASFSLFYSGTSVTPAGAAGDTLTTLTEKVLLNGQANSAGSNFSSSVRTPYGNLIGTLLVLYTGAGPASSTISVGCTYASGSTSPSLFTFNLATTSGAFQTFPLSPFACTNANISYTAGGASASSIALEYLFSPPGIAPTATPVVIASLSANGALPIVFPGNWGIFNTPASGTQATVTRAAGAAGVRHVANCLAATFANNTNGGGQAETVVIRDGAAGVGTIIFTTLLSTTGSGGSSDHIFLCGINAVGSPATPMTIEFTAAPPATELEAVQLNGYDSGP